MQQQFAAPFCFNHLYMVMLVGSNLHILQPYLIMMDNGKAVAKARFSKPHRLYLAPKKLYPGNDGIKNLKLKPGLSVLYGLYVFLNMLFFCHRDLLSMIFRFQICT